MMRTIWAAAACIAACTTVLATPGEPIYQIKQDAPSTGSHIRRPVMTSRVPVNRTWSELTPQEQAVVRSQYEAIAPGDEPPYPAEGLAPLYQAIADAQRRIRHPGTGRVTLVATVNASGDVDKVQTLGEDLPSLAPVIAKLLLLTKFKPAVCSGQPCTMDYPLRLHLHY